jgi:hypothetical protein
MDSNGKGGARQNARLLPLVIGRVVMRKRTLAEVPLTPALSDFLRIGPGNFGESDENR